VNAITIVSLVRWFIHDYANLLTVRQIDCMHFYRSIYTQVKFQNCPTLCRYISHLQTKAYNVKHWLFDFCYFWFSLRL